jgi:hypothetical protein
MSNILSMLPYPIVILLGYKIIRYLNEHSRLMNNSGFQKEINRTLAFQALFPFLFMGVPTIIGYCLGFIDRIWPTWYLPYFFMFRSIVPLINPLVALFCIRSLRKEVSNLFCGCISQSSSTTVVYIRGPQTTL